MKKIILSCLVAAALLSCKKKKDDPEAPVPAAPAAVSRYVVQTATAQWGAGFYNSTLSIPSGDVSNISSNALQVTDVFGTRSFGGWVFDRTNAAGETGLQKYTVNDEGKFVDAGFIADAGNYIVVNELIGYYFDADRGLMKLQTFNPLSMLRTGEIDLSSLAAPAGDNVAYQSVGQHILAYKEGKLYVNICYGTKEAAGYGDDLYNEVKMAVINVITNKLEKTITYSGLKGIGWGSSANKFWTQGDDGALYFYSPGFSSGLTNSTIIRIKAGETDFDNWSIKADDYQQGSTFATALVKGGKLYTQFSNTKLNADFSNLDTYIFDYYVIDLASKQRTKISGMPVNHYAWANEQAITEIDGKIYFAVMTPDAKGYYVLGENNTATKAFNITDGGFIWGLLKLN